MSLIVEQIVTADGYAADEHGGIGFFEAGPDDEDHTGVDADQVAFLHHVDAILLGANTYRMFADYWPSADPQAEPVTEPINRLPKFVVSNTLTTAPWGEEHSVQILAGNPIDTVAALKAHFHGIVVWGSLQLTDALFRAGLVDRLRLRVVPTLLGSGRSYTPDGLGLLGLELDHVFQHPSGHLTLEYAVRRDPPPIE
ncbi:dihydrofolate reductase family protein [Agromyces seonyuensis]|uniref:Reductase n=1 Tax=Agromyces seonyuensis TaxID=2662446 RepID=A0A6I4NXW8_9MICO|nr:dihydrofolate reductase family protein [Agromyces seonyuensis]MWB99156.1 reductase [Agromyces seonyuensis]